jgi:enediyne biosynthesis protein E4
MEVKIMISKKQILLLILVFLTLTRFAVQSQEMTAFEIIDNISIGLTPAIGSKWGVSIGDFNRDGWPDIFQGRFGTPGHSHIYINELGKFRDISDQTPLEQIESGTQEQITRTAVWFDYDNDGDQDLYFGTDKDIHLLRNENNTFTDIAESVGLQGQIPGFVSEYGYVNATCTDFDLDGDLDMVIIQQSTDKPYFFRNENGMFVNIQEEVGLVLDMGRNSGGIQWIDYDLDGDADLSAKALLFQNENGVLTEISDSIGLNSPHTMQNVAWFDYDVDGDFDFFHTVSSGSGEDVSEMFENNNGLFEDVSHLLFSVALQHRFRGLAFGDIDNDGDEDIFINVNITNEMDVMLLNEEVEPGVRVFEDVAEFVGVTKMGDRKNGVFFDYDRDGFLDLYIPSAEHNHILYHNIGNSNNWVSFILEGTFSNRDAIGSLVKCVAGGKTQIRYTRAPTNYLTQDNPYVHFGIGQATNIDSVIIRWPLGRVEVFENVAINQYHNIKEGDVTDVESLGNKEIVVQNWSLEQNHPNPFNPETKITYSLAELGHVRLDVFTILGTHIRTLVDESQNIGNYEVNYNAGLLPSGIYLYRLVTKNFVEQKKMIIIK